MVYEPKSIQIAASGCSDNGSYLYALDEDGNVWELTIEVQWHFIGSPAGIDK
jgi:hypothetical protein